MVGLQVARLCLSFIIGGMVARFLGPIKYSIFNYVLAFTTIVSAVTPLGLEVVVVEQLSRNKGNPGHENRILGTVFGLRFLVSVVLYIAVTIYAIVQNDIQLRSLLIVVQAGMLLDQFTIVDYYFQVHLKNRLVAMVGMLGLAVGTGLRIFGIASGQALIWFAIVILVERCIRGFGLMLVFRRIAVATRPRWWRFSGHDAIRLLKRSKWIFIGSVFTVLNLRIDQIMIGNMLSDDQLAYYSVAVKISEMWFFVPFIITTVAYSRLHLSSDDRDLDWDLCRLVFSLLFGISLIGSIVLYGVAPFFIHLVFGTEYAIAYQPFQILIWASLPVFGGYWIGRLLVSLHQERIIFWGNIAAGFTNVAANIYFIPRFGIQGAAIATIISYLIPNYLILLYNRDTRLILKSIVSSLSGKHWIKDIRVLSSIIFDKTAL